MVFGGNIPLLRDYFIHNYNFPDNTLILDSTVDIRRIEVSDEIKTLINVTLPVKVPHWFRNSVYTMDDWARLYKLFNSREVWFATEDDARLALCFGIEGKVFKFKKIKRSFGWRSRECVLLTSPDPTLGVEQFLLRPHPGYPVINSVERLLRLSRLYKILWSDLLEGDYCFGITARKRSVPDERWKIPPWHSRKGERDTQPVNPKKCYIFLREVENEDRISLQGTPVFSPENSRASFNWNW